MLIMNVELVETSHSSEEAHRQTFSLSEFRRGVTHMSPVLAATLAFGVVFGAQAREKGFSFLEVPLLTATNFAGGSEFAVIGLWNSPPPILLIVAVTFLVNSRHLIMGAALAPFIRHLSRRKALATLYFMADESWAFSLADMEKRLSEGRRPGFSLGYFLGCGISLYLGRVVPTTLGAAIGPVLGDINALGLDMAFPAVFLVLLAGMWKGPRAATPWLVSLVVAASTYLLLPGAWYVVAGTASGLVASALWVKSA